MTEDELAVAIKRLEELAYQRGHSEGWDTGWKAHVALTTRKSVLVEYAEALEANPHASTWSKEDFVRDILEWASEEVRE